MRKNKKGMMIGMGRKLKAEERLGMTFVSNEGCKFFVKEYITNTDVIVKFIDEHGAEIHTSWQCCQNGRVKNPYFTSIYGVGCLGEGDFLTGKNTREYGLWKAMLNRCYSGNYPTYENVTVCDRWLVYANFLEDLPLNEGYEMWLNNPNQRIAMDKDLKQIGVENKVYSLETVKFVTQSENSKEVCERRWSEC